MYKIGDKVETPLGVGKITYISEYITQKGFHIQLKNGNVEFTANHLKPYTSAHDKLIALGYSVENTIIEDNIRYSDNKVSIYIDVKRKEFYCDRATLELSRILTQYLEEME